MNKNNFKILNTKNIFKNKKLFYLLNHPNNKIPIVLDLTGVVEKDFYIKYRNNKNRVIKKYIGQISSFKYDDFPINNKTEFTIQLNGYSYE